MSDVTKCLLIFLRFCEFGTSVCVLAAYINLCRRLEFLLKVRYINLVDHNLTKFFNSRDHFSGEVGNTDLFLKYTAQKKAAFAFGNSYLHQTFTECVSS